MKKILIIFLAMIFIVSSTDNTSAKSSEETDLFATKVCDVGWTTTAGDFDTSPLYWSVNGCSIHMRAGFLYGKICNGGDCNKARGTTGISGRYPQVWLKDAKGNVDYDRNNTSNISEFQIGALWGNDYNSFNEYKW